MSQSSDLFGWEIKSAMSELQRQVSDSKSFKAEVRRKKKKYINEKDGQVFLAESRMSDIPQPACVGHTIRQG